MQKLSIIIPAHDEEKRIGRTLEEYEKYFEKTFRTIGLDYELLVVINNTADATESIVRNFSLKNKKIKSLILKEGGKGYAVINGFKDALKRKNDFIGFVDADLATSPQEYYNLIPPLKKFDGAIADRYIKGAQVFPRTTFRRAVVSRVFNAIIRSLFLMPYKDTQCGAKVFRRNVIDAIIPSLSMSQWAFDVELIYIARKKGSSIVPIPTKWYDKEYSKINFLRAGPWMALAVLRLRIINSPVKKFIRIYDKLIGFIPK